MYYRNEKHWQYHDSYLCVPSHSLQEGNVRDPEFRVGLSESRSGDSEQVVDSTGNGAVDLVLLVQVADLVPAQLDQVEEAALVLDVAQDVLLDFGLFLPVVLESFPTLNNLLHFVRTQEADALHLLELVEHKLEICLDPVCHFHCKIEPKIWILKVFTFFTASRFVLKIEFLFWFGAALPGTKMRKSKRAKMPRFNS